MEGGTWRGIDVAPYSLVVLDDLAGTPRVDERLSLPTNVGLTEVRVDGRGGFLIAGDYFGSPSGWGVPETFEQRALVLRLDATLAVTSAHVSTREVTHLASWTLDDEGALLAVASDFSTFELQEHGLLSDSTEDLVFARGAHVASVAATREHVAMGLYFQYGTTFEVGASRVEVPRAGGQALAIVTRDGRFVRAWPLGDSPATNVVALSDGTFAVGVGSTLRWLSAR